MSLKSADIISEWFEHEKVRAFVKLMTENLQTPKRRELDWARLRWWALCMQPDWAAQGGPASSPKPRAASLITGQDPTGRNDTPVRSGKRVTGIETAEGERYMAQDAVIGAIHPHHLRRYFPDIDEGVLAGRASTDGDLLSRPLTMR